MRTRSQGKEADSADAAPAARKTAARGARTAAPATTTSSSSTASKLARLVLVVGLVVGGVQWLAQEDAGACDSHECPECCFFSETLEEAQAKFRHLAGAVPGMALHRLPVGNTGLDMDVAVLPGRNDTLYVHVSGVHGVEGHAGSAVQLQALTQLASVSSSLGKRSPAERPTLVLMHLVNPYGMKHGRRFNENNVDLNRNLLSPELWKEVLARPKNFGGYEELSWFLSPRHAISWLGHHVGFWLQAAMLLAVKGRQAVMRAVVVGQYWDPRGMYYGGTSLEPSRAQMLAFLQDHGLTGPQWRKVTVIDVHTGLGPQGVDTLLLEGETAHKKVRAAFDRPGLEKWRIEDTISNTDADATGGGGYTDTVGYTKHVGELLFADNPDVLCFSQEFGTVPGVFVLRAMRREHAAYHYGSPAEKAAAAEECRSVFYVRKKSWKKNIVTRGFEVFEQGFNR